MLVIAVLSLSVVVQIVAAFFALRMIRTSKGTFAWVALAAAILLMAVRRSISLVGVITAYPNISQNLQAELVALVISGLMLTSIIAIRPLFSRLRESEQALQELTWRNKTILETSPDGFCIVDAEGHILEMNDACRILFGFAGNTESKLVFSNRIASPNKTKFKQAWHRILRAGEGRLVVKYECADDELLDLELTAKYIEQEKPAFVFLFIRDITEQKEAQNRLYEQKEQAHVTLKAIGDGVITTDAKGHIQFMNHVAEELVSINETAAHDQSLASVLHLKDELSAQPLVDPATVCVEQNTAITLKNVGFSNSKGLYHSLEISVSPLHNLKGDITGTVLVMHDVTDLKLMANELSYQATHDLLTGLINRREFEVRLQKAIEVAKKDNVEHVLCYIDLDQFKVVNDTCGHAAGDELLKKVSKLLDTQIRETDTLARLGGDEFGVLLENCQIGMAEQVANKILCTINETKFVWEENIFDIGASIGLAQITPESGTITDVLSAVDSACYVVKEQGRHGLHVYVPGDKSVASHHGQIKWLARLRRAIENNHFQLYAQSIQPLKDRQDCGLGHAEILLRLVDDDKQIILPDEFLPAAERYNLMPTLDRWVVREALLAMHNGDINSLQNTECSINLSGQSLGDPTFLDEVLVLFKETGVDYAQVCFEITETAMISNINNARGFISTLRNRGCKFSLDDFGSGFSSFKYLKSLPVDYIKIDGCFVHGVASDEQDYNMVKSIHQIGQYMGIRTVAEFVESQAILQTVSDIGIEFAQGYAIDRPSPIVEKAICVA